MNKYCSIQLVISAAVLALCVGAFPVSAQKASLPDNVVPLPALNADLSQVTVSGLSSGAFMAHQIHVAYSDRIKGAGMMAGGPFGCSEGRPCQAVTACMRSSTPDTARPMPSTETLLNKARKLASRDRSDRIAPLSNLATSQVYIAHGAGDIVVGNPQTQGLHDFYVKAGVPESNITMACSADKTCSLSGHAVVTPNGPRQCSDNEHPFLNKCDEQNVPDEILNLFYAAKLGRWNPPSKTLTGQLIAFSQDKELENLKDVDTRKHRLAETGYLYVPKVCRERQCPVHVAFHGCVQSEAVLAANDKELSRLRPGEAHNNSFVRDAGYNASADANGIIILYPQADPFLFPTINYRLTKKPILPKDNGALMEMFKLMCTVPVNQYLTDYGSFGQNPMGCWDWWGYTRQAGYGADDLYLTREAPQMKAVIEMLDKLGGGQAAPGYLEQWNDRSG